MARYVICPRCELNFIDADEQEYCDVCIKELSGERTFADGFDAEDTMEETELCPVCGENYMALGEKMCEECKKKSQYEDEEIEEDKIMEDALECGAEDIKSDDGEYSIYTSPDELDAVRDAIIALGYKIDTADLAKVPSTYVELTSPEDIENMEKMLDKFNEDDDVTAVFTNWDN